MYVRLGYGYHHDCCLFYVFLITSFICDNKSEMKQTQLISWSTKVSLQTNWKLQSEAREGERRSKNHPGLTTLTLNRILITISPSRHTCTTPVCINSIKFSLRCYGNHLCWKKRARFAAENTHAARQRKRWEQDRRQQLTPGEYALGTNSPPVPPVHRGFPPVRLGRTWMEADNSIKRRERKVKNVQTTIPHLNEWISSWWRERGTFEPSKRGGLLPWALAAQNAELLSALISS